MSTFIKKIVFGIITFSMMLSVHADDIDIINVEAGGNSNVLFVLDLSGSMNYGLNPSSTTSITSSFVNISAFSSMNILGGLGTTTTTTTTNNNTGEKTRLDTLRESFQKVISLEEFDEASFGLSVFSGDAQNGIGRGQAHGIAFPISKLTGVDAQDSLNANETFTHKGTSYLPETGQNEAGVNKNTREYLGLLSADSDIWQAAGSTPIVDALYEAAAYFRGEEPQYGKFLPSDYRSAHPSTYVGELSSIPPTAETPASCDDIHISFRDSCEKGSCGATESCRDVTLTQSSSSIIDGASCVAAQQTCEDGVTSCGTGNNCQSTTRERVRFCFDTDDIGACETANPSYFSCEVIDTTTSTTNDEDLTTLSQGSVVRCLENDITTRCDSATGYSCTSVVERCTKCPDVLGPEVVTGDVQYKTPIVDECSSNSIVFLSDGEPTSNTSVPWAKSLMNRTEDCSINDYDNNSTDDFVDNAGRCGPELAEFLATTDQNPNIPGNQFVTTSTIGLSIDDASNAGLYLKDIATKGGGSFLRAESPEGLVSALTELAKPVLPKARSFSAPSFSVDSATNLAVGDFVYVPMFDRRGDVWPGNLKKYKLVDGDLKSSDGVTSALDSNGQILNESIDYWSAAAGIDSVTSGGAANQINPTTRVIKTDNASGLINLDDSIANQAFGLDATQDALKTDLVKYIRGFNADDTPRNHMGSIIHSIPVQLEYADGSKLIFVGTNEGYLHAINDSDGSEAYAYMPRKLLRNIKRQYSGSSALDGYIYGVDSPITVWIDESSSPEKNGILDAGEQAYLFFGLRRGGKAYYALNVTDPASPSLAWKLTNNTANRPELSALGHTWSQPVMSKLKWGDYDAPRDVIIFGGGYNENKNGKEKAGGNRVFIVDAKTGERVWDSLIAENASLVYGGTLSNAIPGKIRALDVDRNGSVDRLYFADTGANIWRVDLNAGNFSGTPADAGDVTKAKIFKFASLGGGGPNNRKFFEEPDIAIFKSAGKLVTSIAIGSGDRTNPLETKVKNHFYALYDKSVLSPPEITRAAIKLSDLEKLPVTTADTSAADYVGWYKTLNTSAGEKVLATSVTYRNKVFFTTLSVTSVAYNVCAPSSSTVAKLYAVDLALGTEDASKEVTGGEILGKPTITFEYKSSTGGDCEAKDCLRYEKICTGRSCYSDVLPITPQLKPKEGAEGEFEASNEVAPGALPRVYWIDND